MKKLMLIALVVLGATAFAAENSVNTSNEEKESTEKLLSTSESFMLAFGMGDSVGKSVENTDTANTEAERVGVTGRTGGVPRASVAANVATTVANNSTTIVTPYGKY